jgi:hypothetical protein
MVCIFDPACELLPPWTKELYGTCVLLPLYCTFSLTSSPLPPFPMYSIYRQCVTVGVVGGVLKCTVDHILQEFYTLLLTRFRTHKIASPPQTKLTSKDNIKGLVSLKFLRPCFVPTTQKAGQAAVLGRLSVSMGLWFNYTEQLVSNASLIP